VSSPPEPPESPASTATTATAAAPSQAPAGVIHDIGYRPYAGPRLGERSVAWAFFVTGLRNCYGLGRSGKSKILPMSLFGLMLLPALILVGVLVQAKNLLDLNEQIVPYSIYPFTTQLLIAVFVAAQAPALISRDLRFRTITLYLARPTRRATYVLVRLASLTTATFILIGAPILLLYIGGLLADLPIGHETKLFLEAMLDVVLLSACLAVLSALVSAFTIRRGLAVAAVIVVLLVSYTVVITIQGISYDTGHPTVGEVAGLFSPYTLTNGVEVYLFNTPEGTPTPPSSDTMGVFYLLWTAVTILGTTGLMLLRYRRVAG
jgi:ABC-2 type transport system permease protein